MWESTPYLPSNLVVRMMANYRSPYQQNTIAATWAAATAPLLVSCRFAIALLATKTAHISVKLPCIAPLFDDIGIAIYFFLCRPRLSLQPVKLKCMAQRRRVRLQQALKSHTHERPHGATDEFFHERTLCD